MTEYNKAAWHTCLAFQHNFNLQAAQYVYTQHCKFKLSPLSTQKGSNIGQNRQMTVPEVLHSEQYPMLTASALVSAAGALRQALLIGYDLPRMEGLWPSEKQCPGFKYTHSVHAEQQGTCTHAQ